MKKFTILLTTICLLACTAIFAADGSWNADDNTWSEATNWVGDIIADGAGNTATFANQMNDAWDAKYVLVDSARTIGTINFGSSSGYYTYWALNTGTITLDNGGSSPVINVNGIWGAMIDSIAGANGFNKTGADLLRFYGDNEISGTVTASAGALGAYNANALKNADVVVAGGILEVGANVDMTANSIAVNSGALVPEPTAGAAASVAIPITCNDAYDGGNNSAVLVTAGATLSITNVTMTAATMFDIQNANSTLNMNGVVSGNHNCVLRGAYDVGTFNINGSLENNGLTIFRTWGGNPRFELNKNQAVPVGTDANEFQVFVDNQSPWGHKANTGVIIDLNNTTQKVSDLVMNIADYPSNNYVEITGGSAALLEVTNYMWASISSHPASNTLVKLTGGKIVNNGFALDLGTKMMIENATFINNGAWWGKPLVDLDLRAGAKIGGTGFFGWENCAASNLVIVSGATIAPGNSVGTVGCWNLEMEEGSLYDWEVDNGSFDMVDVRGGLTLPVSAVNSVTVNVSQLGLVPAEQTNWLAQTADGVVGDTDSVYMDYPPSLTGPEHPEILWGHLMVTGLIPEPGFIGLLSLLALAFLRRK
ncbi:hypothetical protein KAH27_00680 [bacterium]|nr:hypothetical protein [bacterium]